jgi:cytoskeletal protein CcmA (bactofilin family)
MPALIDTLPEANRLYVGEGVAVNGDVHTSGTVIVQGTVEGDVSVGTLIVQETGTITGRIDVAEDADIFGQVIERLCVRGLLILRSGCRVSGTVSCGALQIEQGAVVTGGIHPLDRGADQPNVKVPRKEAARSAEQTATLPKLPPAAGLIIQEPLISSNSRSL